MDEKRIRRTIVSLTEIDKYKRERLILGGTNNTLQLTEAEYQDLNLSCNFRLKTIADLIKEEEDKQCTLRFGVREIDNLFQYNDDRTRTTLIANEFMEPTGLPLKSIVEVAGILGIGKTSLCLQLALNIQIPSIENDFVPNQTVYIVTDGSLSTTVSRANEMYRGIDVDFDTSIENIHFFNVNEYLEILNLFKELVTNNYIVENNIKLIVLDSLSFPFYQNFPRFQDKIKQVRKLAVLMNQLTTEFNLTIVITNQLVLLPNSSSSNSNSSLQPYLGEAWKIIPNHQLFLYYNQKSERNLLLSKSSTFKESNIPFNFDTYGRIYTQMDTSRLFERSNSINTQKTSSFRSQALTNSTFHPDLSSSQGDEEYSQENANEAPLALKRNLEEVENDLEDQLELVNNRHRAINENENENQESLMNGDDNEYETQVNSLRLVNNLDEFISDTDEDLSQLTEFSD